MMQDTRLMTIVSGVLVVGVKTVVPSVTIVGAGPFTPSCKRFAQNPQDTRLRSRESGRKTVDSRITTKFEESGVRKRANLLYDWTKVCPFTTLRGSVPGADLPRFWNQVMTDKQFDRVEEDSPDRCQHVHPTHGQCRLRVVEGTKYCVAHSGPGAKYQEEQKKKKLYMIGKYERRVAELAENEASRSLREEIGILRMMVEERLNACKTATDLILVSGPVSDLIVKIDKLLSTATRVEAHLGSTMDKNQVTQFGQEVVEIVSRHVEDPDTLEEIANEIIGSIERLTSGRRGGDVGSKPAQ